MCGGFVLSACPKELNTVSLKKKKERLSLSIEYHSEASLAIEEILSAQANILYPHSNFMAMGLDHFNVHSQRKIWNVPQLGAWGQLLPCLLVQLLVQLGTTELGGQLLGACLCSLVVSYLYLAPHNLVVSCLRGFTNRRPCPRR